MSRTGIITPRFGPCEYAECEHEATEVGILEFWTGEEHNERPLALCRGCYVSTFGEGS